MKSYYLVSYDHESGDWKTDSQMLWEFMPEGICTNEDGQFNPAWGTPEQQADGSKLIELTHALWALERKGV